MFLKKEMRDAALSGNKTVTRRIWKRRHAKPGSVHKIRKSRYSKDWYFKIEILEVFTQLLGDMTEEDAIAEGFRPTFQHFDTRERIPISALENFQAYWQKEFSRPWDSNQEVWVVRFKLGEINGSG